MPIRVAIFEDNPIVMDAFKSILNGVDGFICTGAFTSCNALKHDIEKSNPDVVLMDIEMYGIDGIEATRIIKTLNPGIKVLIQTVHEDKEKLFSALCAGANGYILKKTSPVKMLEAVTDVHSGGSAMSPGIASKVIEFFQTNLTEHSQQKDYRLTTREKEILQLMTEGKPLPKIAEQLFLGYQTVRSYVKAIYEKLHVASATEAVSKALKERIVK
jgi:DNA-binding NarL/FixJ family response regulator